MGRVVQWDDDAWQDYCDWQKGKAALKRINTFLKDIRRDPYSGIGKPEPLKYDLTGLWSHRINESDRLTYKVMDDCNRYTRL